METIQEKIDRINAMDKKSEKRAQVGMRYFDKIAIVSDLYQNEFYIAPVIIEEFLTPEYLGDCADILNSDFYIKFECEHPEVITKFLPMIPSSVPVLINNPQKIYPYPNIVYGFRTFIDQNVLDEIIKSGRLYINKEEDYNITINIFELNAKSLANVLSIQTELDKYPNLDYSFFILVHDKNTLLKLGDLKEIIKDRDITIKLDDDLFCSEDKDPHSARSVLRNKFEQDRISDDLNQTYYYLDQKFNSLNEVIEFEKEIDVLLTRIPKNSSFVEKITFITMFIINYFKYDSENTEQLRNFQKLFQDKKGVCRDFAALVKILCDRLEIKCNTLKFFNENGADGHAFNVVSNEGIDYFLDVTWALDEIQRGMLESIVESPNFLADNEHFGHEEYLHSVNYKCEAYDREEISKAIMTVSNWKNNYYISLNNLKDLFWKFYSKNSLTNEQDIINAMPGNGGRR